MGVGITSSIRKHEVSPKAVFAHGVGREKNKIRAGECPNLRVRITVFIGALLIGLFDGESSLLQEPRNFVQEPLFEVAHCGA